MEKSIESIWVFHGENGRFASGLFITKTDAEKWILLHKLTGVLTKYPVDSGVYDWAIENQYFTPKKDSQKSSEFIGKFSSASQEHYHYEFGTID